MIRAHLDELREKGGAGIMAGDVFCLMQGKYDRRSSKAAVRPEHQGDNYIDAVVSTAADFFSPYARNLAVVGQGNHETAVASRLETHPTERFLGLLNAKNGTHVHNGHYSGFVIFSFSYGEKGGEHSQRKKILYYHHGKGGDAPVSKGTIEHNRMSVHAPVADIIMSGHTHNQMMYYEAQLTLSKVGEVVMREQLHLKSPTYKNEYGSGMGGFMVEKGSPKPLGAWWLRFTYSTQLDDIVVTPIPAK